MWNSPLKLGGCSISSLHSKALVRITVGIMIAVGVAIVPALPALLVAVVMGSPVLTAPVPVIMGSALFVALMILHAFLIP
jgi:hypothetical protein